MKYTDEHIIVDDYDANGREWCRCSIVIKWNGSVSIQWKYMYILGKG